MPVIFNLASWSRSPEYGRFDDWLKAVLTQGYGLSADLATTMLREGRIALLLDGLDELARNEEADVAARLRAECLTALNLSLYDGATNAVICCRREEFIAMGNLTGANAPVDAKVGVQDLTIGQIERALIRARGSERDRFAALHLLEALGQDPNGASFLWGIAYGFFTVLSFICRRISWFAKLSKPYQRLQAGILFNVLKMGGSLGAFAVGLALSGWREVNWIFPLALFIVGLLLGFSLTSLYSHCVLRLCLTLEGSMPLKYVSFLRYATDLRVLEQEGGQWRFRHQNFQDYFAARP